MVPTHRPGHLVRISKSRKTFEKGYISKWAREVFKIKRVYKQHLPEYTIQDLQSENIIDKFLDHELQAVSKEERQTYKVKRW